jgi:chromosome segregation ATPase
MASHMRDALALINSQEQRIKELTEELEKLKKVKYIFSTVDYCSDDLANALEENNRLTEEVTSWKAIAEGYQKQFEDCAEDRARLTEENERLRAELEQRPPKLIITKLPKKENENV